MVHNIINTKFRERWIQKFKFKYTNKFITIIICKPELSCGSLNHPNDIFNSRVEPESKVLLHVMLHNHCGLAFCVKFHQFK